jgi:zinc protease
MKQKLSTAAFPILVAILICGVSRAGEYDVVVSKTTAGDAQWSKVVDALVTKHAGMHPQIVTFDSDVADALPELRRQLPQFVCFVARPQEAGREFVSKVHHLTRGLNDDPYTDCFWGILTGYDADNALRIARRSEPLVIHRSAAGTEIALDMCEQGVWYSEVKKNQAVKKEAGKPPAEPGGPDDTTQALADLLNDYHADLFVTSGHASEHDWMIGYTYRNGYFRCEHGSLYGQDTKGHRLPIKSDNPKVFLPVGNCLMGHIDSPNCMALAYMNSAGVTQMAGYTVLTWYGYAGWGMLDYFVEQPGRYTCAEAFVASENALIHRMQTYSPDLLKVEDGVNYQGEVKVSDAAKAAGLTEQDGRGLLYDRDVVAFYGDPAWEARMAEQPCAWEQSLTEKDGLYTFEIKPKRGTATFAPINTNGAQRGYRPIIQFFPTRLKDLKLVDGADLSPTLAPGFILIPNPRTCESGKTYRVTFRASPGA